MAAARSGYFERLLALSRSHTAPVNTSTAPRPISAHQMAWLDLPRPTVSMGVPLRRPSPAASRFDARLQTEVSEARTDQEYSGHGEPQQPFPPRQTPPFASTLRHIHHQRPSFITHG